MARGNRLILDRYELIGTAGAGGFGTVQVAWDPRIQRKVAIKTIKLTEHDAYRAQLPGAQAVAASPTDDRWHGAQPWNEFLASEDGEAGQTAGGGRQESTSSPHVGSRSRYDNPRRDAHRASAGYGGRTLGERPYGDNLAGDPYAVEYGPDQVTSLAHLPGLDEARTAAMLQDPRIVTVYDFEIRDRTAYLIMEYVEGITLTRLLDDYADFLTLDIVAAVFDAMAGALMVAHAAGVLHLDIKPDNIIITPQGQAKVTDFGLATLADASGAGTTGGGTIGYMPLEQMRREHLDARTDEWSLASVTYEMLTGDNPFRVNGLDQAEAAIEDAELILPSLCWENLDEQADDVVFYALDPDRGERYASVADFAEEMGEFLGNPDQGREELALVVGDALGLNVIDEEQADEREVSGAYERRKPGLLSWLFSSGDKPVRNEGYADGPEPYDEPYWQAEEDPEPQPIGHRERQKIRKVRTEEQKRRRRVAAGRAVAALCGGLATWFALGNLPQLPTLFSLDPLFLKLVASLVMAAISAITPLVGLMIAFALLGVSFIPRLL